jgi:hypothetical protein
MNKAPNEEFSGPMLVQRLVDLVRCEQVEIEQEALSWIGRNSQNIYAHAILQALKHVLLQEGNSIVEERVFRLVCLLYPQKACSYLNFLKEEVEFVQLQNLLELHSLISIITTRDKAKVALVSRLINGNPLRKELLILSLLKLYDDSFISVHDSAFELGQKYLLVFEMLQSIDVTGFFLQIFSQSFKEYFIEKDGAMQVIVEQILLSQPETALLYENASVESTICEPEWRPDPIEAEHVKILNSYKFGDVFSIFVNLYEGKMQFIEHFDEYFAQKLIDLMVASKGFAEESRQVQVILRKMNKRFGIDLMHKANVMLNDLKESVQTLRAKHCLIISGLYWPEVKPQFSEAICKKIQASGLFPAIDGIKATFFQANPQKSLHFQWTMGVVSFKADGRQFKAAPLDVFLLQEISNHSGISFSQLLQLNPMEKEIMLQSLVNLNQLGLLRICSDDLIFAEFNSNTPLSKSELNDIFFPNATKPASESELSLSKLKFYSGYVNGILTNIGSMTLERLFGVLQRFLQGPAKFLGTIEDLKLLMQHLQEEGAVKELNGEYSVCRKH